MHSGPIVFQGAFRYDRRARDPICLASIWLRFPITREVSLARFGSWTRRREEGGG